MIWNVSFFFLNEVTLVNYLFICYLYWFIIVFLVKIDYNNLSIQASVNVFIYLVFP